MKYLKLLLLLILVGCSTQKSSFDHLHTYQVRNDGPGKGDPGKCYTKMKSKDGNLDWYETICPMNKSSYTKAADCLAQLGYELIDRKSFKTLDGNAMVDFQMNNGLAYGALDEATLYLLIQKASLSSSK